MNNASPHASFCILNKRCPAWKGLLGLHTVLVSLVFCPHLSAASPDQRYVAHLRDRGMHRLAEVYCRDRLADKELTDRQRVELAIELSLVAVAQAYEATPGDRDRHWRQAHRVLDSWLTTSNRPFRLLAELQDALNNLAEAKLARLEHVGIASSDAAAKTMAIQARARQVIANLRDIGDQVETRRRQLAMGQTRGPVDLEERELVGLGRSVALALAQAYREQALSYPTNSADRINAMQQAAESLSLLAAASPADELTWNARVALAVALGELKQTEQGLAATQKWQSEDPPSNVSAKLLAAVARLLAAAGRTEEALQRIGPSAVAPGISPTIDLVRLELLLASDQPNTTAIETLIGAVRANHSPQYVRQAEALVGHSFAAAGDSTTATGKTHAAEHFFRAGQYDAAIAAYDQAAELFRTERNRERAFGAERAAAAVSQKQGQYVNAADRFRRLSLGSVDRDDSATDHREAILCLATAAKQANAGSLDAAMADYLALCREHLRHWPDGNTTDEVRWWLAQSLASRGQWQATLDVLDLIGPHSAYNGPATALLATTYRELAQRTDDQARRNKLTTTAIARLQPAIVGSGDRVGWPDHWTVEQRTCALELARLTLDAGNAAYAEKLLNAAINGSPVVQSNYRNQATPVLAMALVSTGRTAEAIALLRKSTRSNRTADSEPNASLESLAAQLTEQLAGYARSTPPRTTERAAIGQLLLAVLEVSADDSGDWKHPATRYRAAALAAVANTDEARTLYRSLVKQFPKNGDIQEEYALLLTTSSAPAARKEALAAWTRIENGTRRGTQRWSRARQARIDLLTQLGRQDEAAKLKMLTKLLGRPSP